MVWENVNISIDWQPVHAILTRLVTLVNLPWSTLCPFCKTFIGKGAKYMYL